MLCAILVVPELVLQWLDGKSLKRVLNVCTGTASLLPFATGILVKRIREAEAIEADAKEALDL